MAIRALARAANPTLLVHTYDHRPNQFLTPCAWVDVPISEAINHDSGTRRRDLRVDVHVTNKYVSNDQAADEQDALVDLMVEAFTDDPRASSDTSLTQLLNVAGHDEVITGPNGEQVAYACSVLTVQVLIQEGRL
jgi:hypothetical protein